jgi:hypothetical protein
MHYSSIKESTWNAAKLLSEDDAIKDFILVGGTGLALHIEQRQSEDIDLFTEKKYIDNDKIRNFVKKIFKDYSILDEYENYIEFLANDTKITFYSFGMPIKSEPLINNLNIATKNECIAMKTHAITTRTSYKDYYDLYAIIMEGVGLPEIIELAEEKYKTYFNTKLFLEKLLKEVPEDTLEKPKYKITSKDIKEFMEDKVEDFIYRLEKESRLSHYNAVYRESGLDAALAEMKNDKKDTGWIMHYKERIFPDRTMAEIDKAISRLDRDTGLER